MTEEQKAKKKEYQRRYLEKKRRLALENNTADNNWEALYKNAQKEIDTLNAKLEQYVQLCESYAKRENEYKTALQKATLEYNARTDYVLDCIKHAYISAQFAVNSKNEGAKK